MQSTSRRGRKRKNKNTNSGIIVEIEAKKTNLIEDQLQVKAAGICSTISIHSESNNLNLLPPHILGLIFSKLSPIERLRAEKVCRLWRYLCVNYAWSNQASISYEELYSSYGYQVQGTRTEITNRHIEVFLKRSRHYLRILDLHGFYAQEQLNYSLCSSFTHTRNIQTLDMSGIHLTNSSLSLIGRFLPNLRKLILRNSFKNTVMERGLTSLFTSCKYLEHLDLSNNEILAGTSFRDLPTSLLTLNISGCFRIKPDAIRGIRENCTQLTKLLMNQVDTVHTQQLNELFKSLKDLVVLRFSECFGADFFDGQPNLTSLSDLDKLKELRISDNLLVNDEVLRAIGIGCRSLEILDISSSNRHVTEMGLRQISNIPNLNELNLTQQRSLTDQTLMQIVGRGTLKNLVLSKCPKISNESVIHAIKVCKSLKALDISYCIGVTHIIFSDLDKSMGLQHGKNQPNGVNDERKFRLSIARSGIHGNIPEKYSTWIKIVDAYECPFHHPSPAILVAHFLNIPLVLMG